MILPRHRDFVFTVFLAVVGALSVYYATIESIKLELASKAEQAFVANLDKKLSNLESRLTDNFATKADFFALKEDLTLRLARIELRLQSGEYRMTRTEAGKKQPLVNVRGSFR